MTNKQHYIPWVLIFGAGSGVLSIIPIINWLNCLFCGWMLLGAMFAVKVISDKANATIEPGEGAIIGLFTGLVTGVIYGGVSSLLVGAQAGQMEQIMRQFGGGGLSMGVGGIVMMTLCIGVIVFPIFGALGGLIGSAVFKKNTPYGGPPPGGGYGGPPAGGPPAGGPPAQGGGFGGPPQQGGGFGGPPQGGGGFGGPPQGGGGFGGPPQGGGGPMGPPT